MPQNPETKKKQKEKRTETITEIKPQKKQEKKRTHREVGARGGEQGVVPPVVHELVAHRRLVRRVGLAHDAAVGAGPGVVVVVLGCWGVGKEDGWMVMVRLCYK